MTNGIHQGIEVYTNWIYEVCRSLHSKLTSKELNFENFPNYYIVDMLHLCET